MVFETKYIRITVLIFYYILYVTVILISNKQKKIIKILGYSITESLSLYVEIRNLVRSTETYAKGTVTMYT